jgi:outer membrane protein OmpA-like peptidoglycan-associated protein
MFGQRLALKRSNRDDGEKPFWISFADLMTAMMVLFLVALSAALMQAQKETIKAKAEKERAEQMQVELALAKAELERRERERDTRRERRTAEVKAFLDEVEKVVRRHEGVVLDRERHVINFGPRAQFDSGKHDLKLEQANALRKLVPELLASIQREADSGSNWLKRVVVEGFTDASGDYLSNLNLSLQRSQRVVCVLLAKEWQTTVATPSRAATPSGSANVFSTAVGATPVVPPQIQIRYEKLEPISDAEERRIRALFFVGGYSSNSQRESKTEDRRIEMRIEFFQLDEEKVPPPRIHGEVGKCALGVR